MARACRGLSLLTAATCAPEPPVQPFLDLVPVAVSSVPLTRSSDVALATQTTACIGKSYETRVYCVDRTGNVVGNFGREGDGPGEFNSISYLARGPDGTIGVFDWGLSRMTVFMPDGTWVKVPPLFAPARSFLSTVSGYSVGIPAPSNLWKGPDLRALAKTINLLELDLTTGEVLWTRQDLDYLDDDGCFPIPGMPGASGRWVFKGCSGDLYFLDHRDARSGRLVKSPAYVVEFPNDRDVAAHLEGMRFAGPLPAELLKSYEEEYRARPKGPFLGTETLAYDGKDRLWYATSRDRDNFSYLDVLGRNRLRGHRAHTRPTDGLRHIGVEARGPCRAEARPRRNCGEGDRLVRHRGCGVSGPRAPLIAPQSIRPDRRCRLSLSGFVSSTCVDHMARLTLGGGAEVVRARDQLSISGGDVVTKRAIRLKDLSRPWRVALALSLFLHGCDGESGGSTAAVYDSAGVRIVENRDVEGNRTSSWTVSPEATLHLGGTSATRGAELFSELNGVTRLVGGEVVVLEGSLSELRFFGEDGEHIRTIGGKGEGPGEFGRAVSFSRLAGDSLLVRDNRKSSLVVTVRSGRGEVFCRAGRGRAGLSG